MVVDGSGCVVDWILTGPARGVERGGVLGLDRHTKKTGNKKMVLERL